jgi:hypothetical protein
MYLLISFIILNLFCVLNFYEIRLQFTGISLHVVKF